MITVFFSRTLSFPLLGALLYRIQYHFLAAHSLHRVVISTKESKERERLLGLLRGQEYIFVSTYRFGRTIKDIHPAVIFDAQNVAIDNLSVSELYDLMWTLVYCVGVTPRAAQRVQEILPESIPLIDRGHV